MICKPGSWRGCDSKRRGKNTSRKRIPVKNPILPVGSEGDLVGIKEILDGRRMEHEQLLRNLIEAKPMRFDVGLPAVLPKAHGLYAISMIGAPDGQYLHAGRTGRGRNGILGRVWEQHGVTNGT